ncbi:hypothetical protein ACK8P5_25840 (plasmid) [Paenibacillus sp. EC2-1]
MSSLISLLTLILDLGEKLVSLTVGVVALREVWKKFRGNRKNHR